MKQELQDQLRAKHPVVFGSCDFRIGDGWFWLMDDLGAKLSQFPVALGIVCSKFASLRVFASVPPEHRGAVEAIKEEAEAKSRLTCETCGSPGMIRNVHDSNMLVGLCGPCLTVTEHEHRYLAKKKRRR
jgi:hypothetical protein